MNRSSPLMAPAQGAAGIVRALLRGSARLILAVTILHFGERSPTAPMNPLPASDEPRQRA